MTIGTPANVGHNTGTTQVSSASVTTTGAISAGDAIIVNISRQNVNAISGVTSVTDGSSNSYVSVAGHGDAGQNQYTECWICKNATALGSGGTITVNGLDLLSSGPSWGISVWHVTGLDQTTPTDKTNTIDSNASPWATTAQTTTSANELLWVVVGGNQNEPTAIVNADCLPNSGWTQGDAITYGGNSGNVLRSAYQIVSATGSYKGGGTLTAGNAIAVVFASFKGASGGGTVTGSANVGMNDTGGLAPEDPTGPQTLGMNGGGLSVTSQASEAVTVGNQGGGLSQGILLGDDTLANNTSGLNQGMLTGGAGGIGLPYIVGDSGGGLLASSVAMVQLSLGSNGAGIFPPGTTNSLNTVALGTNGGGLTAFATLAIFSGLVTVGNQGGGILFAPPVLSGVVTLGNNDVDGLYPWGFQHLGNLGAGLQILNAFVGNPNGKWVSVLVWIWRPPGQWNPVLVNRWVPDGHGGGMWKPLST